MRRFVRYLASEGYIPGGWEDALPKRVNRKQASLPRFLSQEEKQALWKACARETHRHARDRAVILVMRYTGLRVRDVVTLRKDRIQKGKLFLRTAKTGTEVCGPLPPVVFEALDAIGAKNDYYFWTGESKPKSAVGNYQRALQTLFELAGTPRIHAHLFRHTFATELLLAGNSLETVAQLLGHTSTKVTERSYSHWVKGRQEKLEEAVKNSWARLGTSDLGNTQNTS